MAKIESAYVNNAGKRVYLSYSINGVVAFSLVLRIIGILVMFSAVPAIVVGLLMLLDSPTHPRIGAVLVGWATVAMAFGYFFWFGLANLVCMLVDVRSRLEQAAGSDRR